jgi:hypothetical protein
MHGMRLGILIGALSAAVIGLGAVVVVLLVEDGDDSPPPPPGGTTSEIASETTDASDLVLIRDAHERHDAATDEAADNGKQCPQATYGPNRRATYRT